jgi:hypothetical protein
MTATTVTALRNGDRRIATDPVRAMLRNDDILIIGSTGQPVWRPRGKGKQEAATAWTQKTAGGDWTDRRVTGGFETRIELDGTGRKFNGRAESQAANQLLKPQLMDGLRR